MTETGFKELTAEAGQGAERCPDSAEGPSARQQAVKRAIPHRKPKPAPTIAAVLNARWAVMADSRQWMVGDFRGDIGTWRARKFIYDRDELLEVIAELCGAVEPRVVANIAAWPARHATWWRLRTGRPTPSIAMAVGQFQEA